MLYLTFDSNIWIYLLDASWKANNPLDHLEFWINQKSMQIVLPEIIPEEWLRHREQEKAVRIDKLNDFFRMAEDIIPSGFLESQRKPENISGIVETQLLRIDSIIQGAKILPVSDELKIKVFDWGIQKKAPMHNKTSVADAIIVFSLFAYAAENPSDEFIFISNNTSDFFAADKKTIHPDLEPFFNAHKIKYSKNLSHVVHDLSETYPITIDLNELRKQRVKSRIAQQIYNPAVIKSLKNTKDSVVENKGMIDLILKNKVPTAEQVLMIWGLIDGDISYRNYFYEKVSNPSWFKLLKEKGEFNAGQNPAPVEVDKGFQVPYWPVLNYLSKLALDISLGKNQALIPEIINIVEDCSMHPQDNYTTWYHLLNLLEKLPNDAILLDLFDHIPAWLSGRFQNSLPSISLCEKLLPKFLNEQPTAADLAKGIKILGYLTELKSITTTDSFVSGRRSAKVISVTDLHHLSSILSSKEMLCRLSAISSNQPLLDLGRKVHQILFNFPNGIHGFFEIGEVKYRVVFTFLSVDFNVAVAKVGDEDPTENLVIKDFEKLSLDDLSQTVEEFLIAKVPGYIKSAEIEDPIFRLRFLFTTDLSFSFAHNHSSIFEMEKKRGEDTFNVYATVFRDWLSNIVKEQPARGLELLETFSFYYRYKAPIYRRIVLYVIAKNWAITRSFFVKLISPTDPLHLFSVQYYRKELYNLLDEVQEDLSAEEINLIASILDLGEQGNEKGDENHDRWKLTWVSALRNIAPFKVQYEQLSVQFDFTHERFQQLGKVRITGVSESPVSVVDLLQKDNESIAEFILSFRRDKDGDFTVSGVARELAKAVQAQPSRFADGLDCFIGIPYVYANQLLAGFKNAWHDKQDFDWEKVLKFAKSYIENERFGSNDLAIEDDNWRTTANWFADGVAELLSEGFVNIEMQLNLAILSIAKQLLIDLIGRFSDSERPDLEGNTIPQYIFSSTTGKLLKALLDHTLYRVRQNKLEQEDVKWENEVRDEFERVIKNSVVDSYIVLGLHFDYFYYFDRNWASNTVKSLLSLDDYFVLAFLGGFGFSSAPRTKELYYLFYPFYDKTIAQPQLIDDELEKALMRHYVSLYFYNFEDFVEGGLLFSFLNSHSAGKISEVVTFIWQSHEYFKSMDQSEKLHFGTRILIVWSYINARFSSPETEEEEKLVGSLVHLLEFISVLTDQVAELLINSGKWSAKYYHTHELLEGLQNLISDGEPTSNAIYLGRILCKLPLKIYLSDGEQLSLSKMIRFLYENSQKDAADDFCNQLSRAGHDFAIEIYREYNGA